MIRQEVYDHLMSHTNQEGTFTVDNGMHIVSIEEGEAEGRLEVQPRHLNRMGIVHGGVYTTMMDQAAGTAACSRGDRCRTISCNVQFLDACGAGEVLISRARAVHMGHSVNVVDVRVEKTDGTVCAEGTYTFRMKAGLSDEPPRETT